MFAIRPIGGYLERCDGIFFVPTSLPERSDRRESENTKP